jgi:hypothetical protein
MRTLLQLTVVVVILIGSISCNKTETTMAYEAPVAQAPVAEASAATLLAAGRQPQVAVDKKGIARIVYGQNDSIYCVTSTDNGKTFSEPELIGPLKGLYLGMSMGPQIASSANYSVVTAIDKKGNIHSYRLQHATEKWEKAAGINDIPGSVPEGLISIAADEADNFYAVWLDVRSGKQNKLLFASSTGASGTWADNKVVYESPDKTVCECCKPSIHVQDKQVVLMFRNWLNGSRDFYMTSSTNGGQDFTKPQKLGRGTWKLEGCPMDGGGLLLDEQHTVHTVWQREGKIYYAKPGGKEEQIGKGRNCRISGTTEPVITWNDGTDLKLKNLHTSEVQVVGKGSYLESVELADKGRLLVWEHEKQVFYKKI